ncbi:hypothetical protein FRX31_016874, partial [Thalictrum thalictroides]
MAGTGYILGRYFHLPSIVGSNQFTASSATESEGLALKEWLQCANKEGVTCLVVFSDSQKRFNSEFLIYFSCKTNQQTNMAAAVALHSSTTPLITKPKPLTLLSSSSSKTLPPNRFLPSP